MRGPTAGVSYPDPCMVCARASPAQLFAYFGLTVGEKRNLHSLRVIEYLSGRQGGCKVGSQSGCMHMVWCTPG